MENRFVADNFSEEDKKLLKKGNYIMLPKHIMYDLGLYDSSKILMMYLIDHRLNDDNWNTNDDIVCKTLNWSKDKLIRAVSDLKDKGLLLRFACKDIKTKQRRNCYWSYTIIPFSMELKQVKQTLDFLHLEITESDTQMLNDYRHRKNEYKKSEICEKINTKYLLQPIDTVPNLKTQNGKPKMENPNRKSQIGKPYISKDIEISKDIKKVKTEITNIVPIGTLGQPADRSADLNKKSLDVLFEEFWKEYPKKVSKGQAAKTYNKIMTKKDSPTNETLLNAIAIAKRTKKWLKDGGQYIPHASSWLNNGGWEDEFDENDFKETNSNTKEKSVLRQVRDKVATGNYNDKDSSLMTMDDLIKIGKERNAKLNVEPQYP